MPRRSPSRDRKNPHKAPGRNKSSRAKRDHRTEEQSRKEQLGPRIACPCGKPGFIEAEAERRLTQYQANPRPNRPPPSRIYQCQLSGSWHLAMSPN